MATPKLIGKPLPYHSEHIYLSNEVDLRHNYQNLSYRKVSEWLTGKKAERRKVDYDYAPLPKGRGFAQLITDIRKLAAETPAWLIIHTTARDYITQIPLAYAVNLAAPIQQIEEAFHSLHPADRCLYHHYTLMADRAYQAAKRAGGVSSLHAEIETGIKALEKPTKLLPALELPTADIHQDRLENEFISGEIFGRDRGMLLNQYHIVQQVGTNCLSRDDMPIDLRDRTAELLKELARNFIDKKLHEAKQATPTR